MPMDEDEMLKNAVYGALTRAKINGRSFFEEYPRDIAFDLNCYDSACEDYTIDEMVPYIKSWLKENT